MIRSARGRSALVAFLAANAMWGCGVPATRSRGPETAPPMELAVQRILLLPPRVTGGTGGSELIGERLGAALEARSADVTWVRSEELLRALRRSPGYAPPPAMLPEDPMWHGRERRIEDPLASHLRRYGALMNARLLVLPRATVAGAEEAAATLRLDAVVIDTRSGAIVWWGVAEDTLAGGMESAADRVATMLARQMLSGSLPTEP